MVKKLLTFILGLELAAGASATINFPASSVQYWVGSGSNSAVVVVAWDDAATPTALAWGVRWNGTVSALDLIDSIQTYDSRFSNGSSATAASVTYNDGTVVLTSDNNWWCYTVNGAWATVGYTGYYMSDGDIMELSGSCDFSMTSAVAATDPNPAPGPSPDPDPVDATIAFSDILYWVGSGSDSAALIVNYGQPDTAFAWGFLFNGTTTAQAMLDSIAAADPRFWYVGSPSMGGDIHFILNNGDTLGLSPVGALGYNFWWANLNGRSAGAGIGATLHNGYVFKYGDLNSAIGWDTLGGYCMEEAWIKAPTPVSVPDTTPILDTIVPPPSLVDATVDLADITCWAGSGPDSTALIVSFANPDTAFAWGVLINGTTTSADMLDAVMAVDTNLSITDHPDWGDGQIRYRLADGTVISRTATQWIFNINGTDAWGDDDVMAGDVFKFGDQASGIQVSTFQYIWIAEPTIVNFCDTTPAIDTTTPVTPTPVEATIAASDILYWVGHGSNEAVLAVNWADTALAWGFRFDGSATVADMMDAIAAADPRFSYVGSTGSLSDILYIDTASGMTDTLRGSSWWGSTNNGVMDAGMGQALANGDFEKWADPAAGVVVDSTYWEGYGWGYTYVYPMAITPVSVPDTATTPDDPVIPDHGPFCGPAGTEGSNAIAGNSDLFVAWATGITLQRGPDNIAVPNSPLATYGDDTMALGPVVMTDNLKVVSLGDGGMATLTFAQPITNGDGPDFAVFENGFDDYFLELAFVEVSSDGNRFVRFPATSLTQTETQATRLDPTFINNLAGKYRMGYGTPFDLEELRDSTGINIDSITHVRIIDVVGSIDPQYATYDAFGHIVNDPWPTAGYGSTGFDLDAVGVIHQLDPQQAIDGVDQLALSLWPNPAADRLNVTLDRAAEAVLYDLTGRQLAAYSLVAGRNSLDISSLDAGVYMLRVEGTACKIIKK